MKAGETDFYAGEVVFDKKRTDPTDDLLVVVAPNVGTVETLDGETRRKVKHNDTNVELNGGRPVDDSEQCVAAAYISNGDHQKPSLGDTVYTFPEFRLETVESPHDNAIDGYQPYQWALAKFLSELVRAFDSQEFHIQSVEDLQVLCMEASIDGKIITLGSELGLGTRKTDT